MTFVKKTIYMIPETFPAELVAHWPLSADFENVANQQLKVTNHNVELAQQVAHFNGRDLLCQGQRKCAADGLFE
jgi:hypothetical protein